MTRRLLLEHLADAKSGAGDTTLAASARAFTLAQALADEVVALRAAGEPDQAQMDALERAREAAAMLERGIASSPLSTGMHRCFFFRPHLTLPAYFCRPSDAVQVTMTWLTWHVKTGIRTCAWTECSLDPKGVITLTSCWYAACADEAVMLTRAVIQAGPLGRGRLPLLRVLGRDGPGQAGAHGRARRPLRRSAARYASSQGCSRCRTWPLASTAR